LTGEGLQAEPLSMAALWVSLRRRSPWWLPASLLALGVAALGLLAGWPLSVSLGFVWALILVVGLARSASHGELRLYWVPLGRVLLWLAPVLVLGWEILTFGLRPGKWDLLLFTGVLAFVIAVEMADRVPGRFAAAFGRVRARGVLDMTAEARERFDKRLDERVRKWTAVGRPVVALIIFAIWIAVLGPQWPARFALSDPLMLFECLCGWVAGERVGQMIAYGVSWRPREFDGTKWQLFPGHPDGAGGFRPIGDFFFYQSVIAGIPAIYLAAWWLFIPQMPGYRFWRGPYMWLLLVAIGIEVMTFILPMLSVHMLMSEQKTQLLEHADELSSEIESLQQRLRQPESATERQQIKDSIADMTDEYQRIEQVPTWPIDSSIRRRFSLSNVALFLPFVGYAVGGTTFWQELSNALHNLGK
jgi:hypothetical protein